MENQHKSNYFKNNRLFLKIWELLLESG